MVVFGMKKWRIVVLVSMLSIMTVSMLASADRRSLNKLQDSTAAENVDAGDSSYGYFVNYLFQTSGSGYQHVWPEMEFGWKIVVGSFIGFCGAAFGSVGGVGGGGIFVPMLTLIIGFDPKSATAISKCMIMGAAASTVYYNLKLRHPTLDMPIIDYDLAVLIQPMLMLGVSIGVAFNVIFADWMVTVLLIILFIGTSSKAFCRGVETWNKETIMKQEAAKQLEPNGGLILHAFQFTEFLTLHVTYAHTFFYIRLTNLYVTTILEDRAETGYKLLPGSPSNINDTKAEKSLKEDVTVMENVCWKEFGLLAFVWVAFLALQIAKTYTSTCSVLYWVLNLLQVPVSVGVSSYEAFSLYKGTRTISSKGHSESNLEVGQLILYCSCGILAGMVGGLLGLGGGFIMGPLFLELGIPPQASSATATFAMMFSASMSVVEYYLLKRFPVPYALYFLVVATIAAFVGQHVVRRLIIILGRASLIIFILAFTIFVSAISLGGVGISNMIDKVQQHEYMGFENLCKYEV